MASAAEKRSWLIEQGYQPGMYGRLSGEMHDIYTATVEGYLPKGEENVVHYVNQVRKWMMSSGNGIERLAPIPGNWFAKYNRAFDLEDTTEEVLKAMEEESALEETVVHEPGVEEVFPIEPLSLADLKAMEAAEAEAHQVNRERYSGTAKVTLTMNRSFANVISTAVFEAHTMIDGAFGPDGTPTDSTYRDLMEAMGCLKQAAVLLENLLVSFHPKMELQMTIDGQVTGQALVGKRVALLNGTNSSGTVEEYDYISDLYRITLDDGMRYGTAHLFLKRGDFEITD